MTKTEFQKFISLLNARKEQAIKLRDNVKINTKNYVGDIIYKNYLQGGIDTLVTLIEGLENRYNELIKKEL